MAATVSWDGLRELASFRAEKGCAISVYVDLDPSVAPTAGDAASRVNSLMHEGEMRAESAHELTHEQREALVPTSRGFASSSSGSSSATGHAASRSLCRARQRVAHAAARRSGCRQDRRRPGVLPLPARPARRPWGWSPDRRGRPGTRNRLHPACREARGGRRPVRRDARTPRPGRLVAGALPAPHRIARSRASEGSSGAARSAGSPLQSPRIVVVTTEETRAELEEVLSHEARNAIVGWTQAEAHATPPSCSRRPGRSSRSGTRSRSERLPSAGARNQGAAAGRRRVGPIPSRRPRTGESSCSSSRKARSTLPGSARAAGGSAPKEDPVRSTERRWSSATTVSIWPSTRRSRTAEASSRCGTTRISTRSRGSAPCSGTRKSRRPGDGKGAPVGGQSLKRFEGRGACRDCPKCGLSLKNGSRAAGPVGCPLGTLVERDSVPA